MSYPAILSLLILFVISIALSYKAGSFLYQFIKKQKQKLKINQPTVFGIIFNKNINYYSDIINPYNEQRFELKQEFLDKQPLYNYVQLITEKDKVFGAKINLSSNLRESDIEDYIETEINKLQKLYKDHNENLVLKDILSDQNNNKQVLKKHNFFLSGEKTNHTYFTIQYDYELTVGGLTGDSIENNTIHIEFKPFTKKPETKNKLQPLNLK